LWLNGSLLSEATASLGGAAIQHSGDEEYRVCYRRPDDALTVTLRLEALPRDYRVVGAEIAAAASGAVCGHLAASVLPVALTNGLRLGLRRAAVLELAGGSASVVEDVVQYSWVDSTIVPGDSIAGARSGSMTAYRYRGWEVHLQRDVVVMVRAWARSET